MNGYVLCRHQGKMLLLEYQSAVQMTAGRIPTGSHSRSTSAVLQTLLYCFILRMLMMLIPFWDIEKQLDHRKFQILRFAIHDDADLLGMELDVDLNANRQRKMLKRISLPSLSKRCETLK